MSTEIGEVLGSSTFVELAPGTIASDYALQNLNKALGEAQNEFLPSVKSVENDYGHYDYVPLEAIVAAVRPSLCKYHLTVSQFSVTDLESKTIAVYTRLVHWDSGEWMQNMFELPAEMALGKEGALKFNQQTIGGSQTYGQKYPYKSIVGIPDSEGDPDSKDEGGDLKARSTKNKKTLCPNCGKDAIIKGREEYGGGWLCYKKNGGCGAKFATDPATITRTEEEWNGSDPGLPSETEAQPPAGKSAASPAAPQSRVGPTTRIPPTPPENVPGLLCTVKSLKEWPKNSKSNASINVMFDAALDGKNQEHTWVCAFAICWSEHLFDVIRASVGKECQFAIKERDKKIKVDDEWPTHFIDIVDVISITDPSTGEVQEFIEGKPIVFGKR